MHVNSASLPASKLTGPAIVGARKHLITRGVVWRRMIRVLRFDRTVYAEVESDPHGTGQAMAVVTIVTVAAVLGTVLLGMWRPGALAGAVAAALIHWLLWSALEHVIGTVWFRTPTSFTSSVRALGYAQTPQLLAVFAFIPVVGNWIVIGSRLLTMIAGSQAVRTTFELRRRQALAIRLASFGIAVASAAFVEAAFGEMPFLTALLRP